MNEREQMIVRSIVERLRSINDTLVADGWRPEVVVLAPTEIERIPGYKVALVIPIDTVAT